MSSSDFCNYTNFDFFEGIDFCLKQTLIYSKGASNIFSPLNLVLISATKLNFLKLNVGPTKIFLKIFLWKLALIFSGSLFQKA